MAKRPGISGDPDLQLLAFLAACAIGGCCVLWFVRLVNGGW